MIQWNILVEEWTNYLYGNKHDANKFSRHRWTLSLTKNDWNVKEVIGSLKEESINQSINQTDKQSSCCSVFLLLFQFQVKSKKKSSCRA